MENIKEIIKVPIYSPERQAYMEVTIDEFIKQLEAFGFPEEQIIEMAEEKVRKVLQNQSLFEDEIEKRIELIFATEEEEREE